MVLGFRSLGDDYHTYHAFDDINAKGARLLDDESLHVL
jgi:hypothetical protein